MKGYTLAAGLILAAVPALGQTPTPPAADERPCISSTIDYSRANTLRVRKNFLWTLQSDNDGVTESCLAHIAQMRIMLPNEDMKEFDAPLNQLAINGRTQVIRYKAYLTSQVFASPVTFRHVAEVSYASSDEFFTAIATRLQQTILGYQSR